MTEQGLGRREEKEKEADWQKRRGEEEGRII